MSIFNLKEKVQNILHLPSLPAIAMEVMSIIEDPKTNVHTLSHLIAKDQVLASKVIKISNSPFYGYEKTISTIDFAIVIVGFETLKEVIMSISIISHLNKNISKDFNINSLWDHSITTSVTARELAKYVGYKVLGEAFVAGLIHDLGIVVLNQYFNKEFNEVASLVKEKKMKLLDAEMKVYGFTHDEVGSWLGNRWNFPKQLTEAIRYHHNPGFASINKQLVSIAHYAEALAHKFSDSSFALETEVESKIQYLNMLSFKDDTNLDTFFDTKKKVIEEDSKKIKSFINQ